jgi:hypothetical protein
VELDPEPVTQARDLPRIAVAEPPIRDLDLLAVDDPLVEDAVVVAEAVTVRGVTEGGQRIQEARRQTTQPAVAQARVPLRLAEVLETVAQLAERLCTSSSRPRLTRLLPSVRPIRYSSDR